MTGTALRAKITKALAQINATDAIVYYRVYATLAGDELLGTDTEVVFTDYEMTPQPAVITNPGNPVLGKSNVLSTPRKNVSTLEIVITPDSVPVETLYDKGVNIVFKRGTNLAEESEYEISSVIPYYYNGTTVALKVLLTSKVTSA